MNRNNEERRHHDREQVHCEGTLSLRGRTIPCRVKNRSRGGVLLEVDAGDAGALTPDDIGQEISLSLQPELSASIPPRGRIIRLLNAGPETFIAIFFL
ncbi:MAG: PilZ domain-containing protein [Spirochaetes bacterium]|nr:PilZ domain-containing protein [Spirochaetota bacterium]